MPFDLTCALGRARDHQQRPVVLTKDAQGRRSKQLEASAPSHDDEICVYVGGVFENRASCATPPTHARVSPHPAELPRRALPGFAARPPERVYGTPGPSTGLGSNGVGRFESFDRMHHREPRGLASRQSHRTPEDVLRRR